MACRSLLSRLERSGAIRVPPRQRKSPNGYRNPLWADHGSEPIVGTLKDVKSRVIALRSACDARQHHLDAALGCDYLLASLRGDEAIAGLGEPADLRTQVFDDPMFGR